MANWGNMILTTKGQILYAKAQTGINIKFTKIGAGSGQIGTQNAESLNALIEPKIYFDILSKKVNTAEKMVAIRGTLKNDSISEAFSLCELGLFAEDPDDGEILYCYVTAGSQGDYISPSSSGPRSWTYELNAAVGNAPNVTVNLSQLQYDLDVINSNEFSIISGENQKEINKSIDAFLSDLTFQTAGGTATAITLTLQTLVNGYAKTFIASANNGGAATTINSKPVYKPGTTTAPKFIAGKAYTVWYNSSGNNGNGCFFIKASATGTALASQVLKDVPFSNEEDTDLLGTLDLSLLLSANIKAGITINGVTGAVNVVDTTISSNGAVAANIRYGYKCYVNGVLVTGTATEKAAATITPTTTDQTIASGVITTGVQTIKGDADLIARNIVSTANIFGVQGTASIRSLGGFEPVSGTKIVNVPSSTSRFYLDLEGEINFVPTVIYGTVGGYLFIRTPTWVLCYDLYKGAYSTSNMSYVPVRGAALGEGDSSNQWSAGNYTVNWTAIG